MSKSNVKASSDCFVSIIAPLYNDADIIEIFLDNLTAVLANHYENYEIVLVDDGSSDQTVATVKEILKRYDYLRLICLSRHFGEDVAITAGLDSVIGDYVAVVIPASDPPTLLPDMIEHSRRSGKTIVGMRKTPAQENFLIRMGRSFFYWYTNRVLQLGLLQNSTSFRVMTRGVVNGIIQIKDRYRYLRDLTAYVGFSVDGYPYEPVQLRAKAKKRRFWELANLAINIVIANSTHPLRFASIAGLLLSGLNLLYVSYVIVTYLLSDEIAAGWATRSIQSSTMFFFLFIVLAVLCEYVGRILGESQSRPLYYIQSEHQSSAMLLSEERKNVVTRSQNESSL